jgi:hypothetical protein
MAENNQDPMIKVLGFKTTYERLPVRGDILDENVDDRGFRLDAKGKRVMENQEVDWVSYAPAHSPVNTMNWERIKHIQITDEMLSGEVTEKIRLMAVRWHQIAPAYAAWKAGHEMPVAGTPLSAWAGVTAEKAEVLRRYAIRTVEEVAKLAEGQLEKIQLPGMRDLKKSAQLFLDGRGAAEAAERETERDSTIAALETRLREQDERMAAMMDLLEQKTNPTSEADQLRPELDAKGIKYHHKAGVDNLRALLTEQAA